MPVYACKIEGSTDVRLVRARSQSQAAKHLVECDSVSAEQMADLIGKGVKLETAAEPAVQAEEEPAPETPEQPPKGGK